MATSRRATGFTTIYALAAPETGEIRYVGKTVLVPRDRLREHMRDSAGRMAHTHLSRWLRTLDGEPTQLVLEECDHADGCAAERRWIAELREQGARLTNLTDGGEGMPGFRMSATARAKMARAATGRCHSPETRLKISLRKRTPGSKSSKYDADGELRGTDPASRDRESGARLSRRWREHPEEMLATIRDAQARSLTASHSGEATRKRSEAMRRVWADPEQRARRSAAISAAKRRD